MRLFSMSGPDWITSRLLSCLGNRLPNLILGAMREITLHEKKPAFDCLFIVLVVTGFFTQPLYLTIFIPTIHR